MFSRDGSYKKPILKDTSMLFFTRNPHLSGDRENLQCEYELAGCSLWGPLLPASAVDDKMHCILSQYKPDSICSPISQRNDIFIRAAWSHRHQRHSGSWLGGLWELTEAVLPLPAHYCSSLGLWFITWNCFIQKTFDDICSGRLNDTNYWSGWYHFYVFLHLLIPARKACNMIWIVWHTSFYNSNLKK